MKNTATKIRKIAIIAIIIILLAIIIAAPGCKNDKKTPKRASADPKDITAYLDTYASEDASYILELADYRNLTITKDLSVSESEINDVYLSEISKLSSRNDFSADPQVIDPLFEKFASLTPADKLTEEGDFICFDYSGKIDGEPLTGGIASYQFTWLGSGNFIPGFEESIVGHAAGTTFPITVTFPSSYPQNTDLENKEVVFDITVRYIFPGITDDAIAALVDYERTAFNETKVKEEDVFEPAYTTAAGYRDKVRASVRAEKETTFEQNLEGYIMEKIYKESKYGTVPQDKIDSFKQSVQSAADMYGVTLEIYLYYAYGGMSLAEFDELARFQVCARSIFTSIINNENMIITQEEFDEKSEVIAENYGYDSAAQLISEAGKENVCNSIYIEKAIALLKSLVKVEVIE